MELKGTLEKGQAGGGGDELTSGCIKSKVPVRVYGGGGSGGSRIYAPVHGRAAPRREETQDQMQSLLLNPQQERKERGGREEACREEVVASSGGANERTWICGAPSSRAPRP